MAGFIRQLGYFKNSQSWQGLNSFLFIQAQVFIEKRVIKIRNIFDNIVDRLQSASNQVKLLYKQVNSIRGSNISLPKQNIKYEDTK